MAVRTIPLQPLYDYAKGNGISVWVDHEEDALIISSNEDEMEESGVEIEILLSKTNYSVGELTLYENYNESNTDRYGIPIDNSEQFEKDLHYV